jgi:tetratricopeptide (TPR) repeat protein
MKTRTSPRSRAVLRAERRFGARVLLCSLLFLAVALGAAAQDAVFQGKVLDPKGKGTEGAKVTLTKAGDPAVVASATSDKKGAFKVAIDSAGEFVLRAEKAGFGPAQRAVKVELGMQYGDANLQLLDEATWKQAQAVEAFNAGVNALQSGKEEEAIAKFEEALAINPQLAHAHYARAAALHGLERWADAAEAIDRYRQAQPDDNRPELYQLAFEAYFGAGLADKADQALARITEPAARAQLAPPIYNAGVERTRQEDLDGAIEMFQMAAELDPSFAQAHQNVAAIEFNRQAYALALVALDKLLAAKPDSVEGLRMRFFSYRSLSDPRQKDALVAYLAKAPATAGAEVASMAADDFEAGNADAARTTLEMLVGAQPKLPEAHYHLGLVCASQGRNAEAKEHLQHFLDLAPSHPEAEAAKAMMTEL